jgi:hypothetical protein
MSQRQKLPSSRFRLYAECLSPLDGIHLLLKSVGHVGTDCHTSPVNVLWLYIPHTLMLTVSVAVSHL